MFDQDNPDDLHERAETYDRLAQRITDDQALKALRSMANDYRTRANCLITASQIAARQGQHQSDPS